MEAAQLRGRLPMKTDPAVGGLLVLSRSGRSMEEDEEVRDRVQSLQFLWVC